MSSESLPIVILVGPAGCGKSTHAAEIAQKFGCTRIVDPWNGRDPLKPGTLGVQNIRLGAETVPAEGHGVAPGEHREAA